MTATTTAIVILVLAGLGVLVFLVLSARRRRRGIEDIPPGLRPGYADDELEKGILERTMGWGVVLTLFFAVFFPLYWLNEESRLEQASTRQYTESLARGQETYQTFCARCHGSDLGGGAAPAPDGEGTWPAPNLSNIVARYEPNKTVDNIERFINKTITQGRPGTPMPTWGMAFGGSLTDQQIRDLTNYILANQVAPEGEAVTEAQPATGKTGGELFAQNCARCHGQDLQGKVGPSLIGVFDRHSEEQIMAILRGGIRVPVFANMPPWQNGYMYPGARYTDEALASIVDYLRARQPQPGGQASQAGENSDTGASASPPAGEEEAASQA